MLQSSLKGKEKEKKKEEKKQEEVLSTEFN